MVQVKQINCNDRELVVQRISKVSHRQCFIEIFKYLVRHHIDFTINNNGALFNVSVLSQNTVYEFDDMITKYENDHS